MPRTAAQRLKEALHVDDLAEVDTTQPLEQRTSDDGDPRGAEIVKATKGRSNRDAAYVDLIQIVHHAELQVYEGNIGVRLQSELDNARRQMEDRRHVDPAVINELARLSVEWQFHRGLKDEQP